MLRTLPDESVNCCVTSPPYWGLRDYQTGAWEGGSAPCDHAPTSGLQGQSGDRADRIFTGPVPQKDICSRCGAHRIDAQIGLERTPEEYVGKLVVVFREVRRVLHDDGTLWLNLGDSYAGSWGAQSRGDWYPGTLEGASGKDACLSARQIAAHPHRTLTGSSKNTPGLKPKDLVGIPWRVAFALQQPHYMGSIKDERDRIWLAAMLDAEGCMFIHRRKAGQHSGQGYYRQNDTFGPGVEIANTSQAVVERILKIVGKGSICSQSPEQNNRRKQTIYRWNLRTTESVEFVRELYPHLIAKQRQARLLCGCPSSGVTARHAHAALIALHRGHSTDFDLPEPDSLWEKGWYLRSDVIWSKANPMPESVTDRPTKAHEYVFLFAKSERYHYNADAIREPLALDTPARYRRGRSDAHKYTDGGPGNQTIARSFEHMEKHHRIGMDELTCYEKIDRYSSGNKKRQSRPSQVELKRGNQAGSIPWHCDGRGRNRRSVWTLATCPTPEAHYAPFPIELPETCILAGCPEAGLVLDPFSGVATTGLACLKNNRRYLGIELNRKYIEISYARARKYYSLFAQEATTG